MKSFIVRIGGATRKGPSSQKLTAAGLRATARLASAL